MIRSGSIMTAAKFEKNYEDRTEMLNGILDFYKEKNVYENFYKELEYLAVLNGYFAPSRDLILQNRKSPVIKKFKNYIHEIFPDFKKNIYLNRYLSKKDKWHLLVIESEQYWLMTFLSRIRSMVKK